MRWDITGEDEHFWEAKTILESLDPQQHWEPLARLLIEHGDYDGANDVLQKPLELGDIVAHLLAVDVQLRLGKSDYARQLFLELPEDSIDPKLQYPYGYTMGLVALAAGDPTLRVKAASLLRTVLQKTPALQHAKTLLGALEQDSLPNEQDD